MSRRGRYHQVRENLHIKKIIVGDGEARQFYVLVYNPKEAERQRQEREKLLESLKEELEGLRQLPNEVHHKATCHLRSHPSYGKYLRQLKDGTLRIDKQAVRDAEKYDGKYLIRTSDDTLSAEDVALGYKQLVDIERTFRMLKSTLELRPMYHRLENRMRAHVLLYWLALLLIRIIEMRTGESWAKTREELQRLTLRYFSSNTAISNYGQIKSKSLRL